MAKHFSDIIGEVMPLVKDRDSSAPFIISRDSAYGDWLVHYPYPAENAKSFLESQREHDPYAVMFKGSDFADGSFATVHDKVLCARFRAEYDAEPSGTVHGGEFRALINAVEDNIESFSQKTIDYLLEYEKPLHELYYLSPIPLYNLNTPDNEPYDADRIDEFVETIDNKIGELIARPKEGQESEYDAKLEEAFAAVRAAMPGIMPLVEGNTEIREQAPALLEENFNNFSNAFMDFYKTLDKPREFLDILIPPDMQDKLYEIVREAIAENKSVSLEPTVSIEYDVDDEAYLNKQTQRDIEAAIENGEYADDELEIDGNTEDFSDAKVNEYDPTRVISSLTINGVDIELGEDAEHEQPFYVESNRINNNENLFSMRTTTYAEAIKAYTEQILDYTVEVSLDRDDKAEKLGVEYVKLTDEHCLPDGKDADYTGKLIIVDAKSLLPEYRSSTSQLIERTHGNGARHNATGGSVFGKELYSGANVVYGRHQILGIADEEKLPRWAKDILVFTEAINEPDVFEFGGYHFKPYRKFEKRDGNFDAQMQNVASDYSLGIATYEWKKADYSHSDFYAASGDSDADIFKCVENGKLYVPCENELFSYNESPQRGKEAVKTFTQLHQECASAIDETLNEVRTPGKMTGTATYDLNTALNNLNSKYGGECVAVVLAAIVVKNDFDGRYSNANKVWANSFDTVEIEDVQYSIRYCTVNTHPTVLDGLVNKAREKSPAQKRNLRDRISENQAKAERNKSRNSHDTDKHIGREEQL